MAVALVLLPVPAVGFVLLDRAQVALEEQLRETQLAVADEVSAGVNHESEATIDGLETLARVLVDDAIPEASTETIAARLVEGHQDLEHVAIYDGGGRIIDRVVERGSDIETPDELPSAFRTAVLDEGTSTYTDETGGQLLTSVRLMVDGEPTGWLATPLSPDGLEGRVSQIAQRRFGGGLADSVVVVDAQGAALAGQRPGHDDWASHPLITELEGERFTTPYAHQRVYSFDGQERVGTLVSIPTRRWGVIVQQPTELVFGPIRQMRTLVVVTVGLVVGFALLLGLLLARSITAPLRRLTDLAAKLGRRELGETVVVETNDELRVLGDTLSRASTDLLESEDRVRREEAIRADLGRYVSSEIVERVIERKQDMRLGGTRQQITVLFADVVAFTPLSEEHPPEEVVSMLNELFTILTEIVFRHGGTVDKFIGDCVMALFGAPEPTEDHAQRALDCAEDMLSWLEAGNAAWLSRYGVEVKLAIGVHTGDAVVGNVGSETRMAYTAIGDVVNVAARLEAIARPNQILITRETREAAGEQHEFVEIGERSLSGRKKAIHLFEVRA
ncbi:MAG: adenylate/guanylate cyclase domain-containing protein [Sandaracinaceae bacterium]